MASRGIRAVDTDVQIGIATTGRLCYPATDSAADIAAARAASFAVSDDDRLFTHHMALDPICPGHYPDCGNSVLNACIAAISAVDLSLIHAVPDFIALNIYNGSEVRVGPGDVPVYCEKYAGFLRTALK